MIKFIGQRNLIESEIIKDSTVEEVLNYFKDHEEIQVDTETQGLCPHTKKLITLQIGDEFNQFVIDCRVVDILQFKELLESKLCLFVNAKFDYKFLKHNGIVVENIYDCMLAEQVIYNGLNYPSNFQHLADKYLNIDVSKATRGQFQHITSQPLTDKQIEYAAIDVQHLSAIKRKQKELIDKYELQYAVDLENRVVKAFADMEYYGMHLDSNDWNKLAVDNSQKLHDICLELDDLVLEHPKLKGKYKPTGILNLFGFVERKLDINYSSPQQVLKLVKLINPKIESTVEEALSPYTKDPVIGKLVELRKASKVVTTYGTKFLNYINKKTGRVHSAFWQIKETFRVGSGDKKSNAPNIQNIPAKNEFRNCFKPRDGFNWLSIDYAAQELRLMADFSQEQNFIDALNNDIDLHCMVGTLLSGKTITKEDKKERQQAKTINFGKP